MSAFQKELESLKLERRLTRSVQAFEVNPQTWPNVAGSVHGSSSHLDAIQALDASLLSVVQVLSRLHAETGKWLILSPARKCTHAAVPGHARLMGFNSLCEGGAFFCLAALDLPIPANLAI